MKIVFKLVIWSTIVSSPFLSVYMHGMCGKTETMKSLDKLGLICWTKLSSSYPPLKKWWAGRRQKTGFFSVCGLTYVTIIFDKKAKKQ